MEIYERRPAPVRIGDLEYGDVFRYDGAIYMVCDDGCTGGYTSEAVNLASGNILSVANDKEVTKLQARVTVWEDNE